MSKICSTPGCGRQLSSHTELCDECIRVDKFYKNKREALDAEKRERMRHEFFRKKNNVPEEDNGW